MVDGSVCPSSDTSEQNGAFNNRSYPNADTDDLARSLQGCFIQHRSKSLQDVEAGEGQNITSARPRGPKVKSRNAS